MARGTKAQREELHVLEEHFLDELRFKIAAVLSLHHIEANGEREIASFVTELQRLTKENLTVLNTYASK